MKKSIALIILIICSATAIYGQNKITGRLLDATTRQPIDFANISVLHADDNTPLTGTITDNNGNFSLTDLTNGEYIVTCSFIGYIEQTRKITLTGKPLNLGKIYLAEDTQQLQEVEVVAQGTTMRFELDKKVFSVDQNIASTGGSATDVLENIPSVDVDQEGNISLRNSESVEIWINGKPSGITAENRAQIMDQLPAESIKEIEIITNPSAKYSPEGTAGIINLVMKQDRKAGYYGSVNGGISYPWGGLPGGNAGFNFNFSTGIVDAYINAGYHYRSSHGGTITDRKNIVDSDTITRLSQHGSNNRGGGGLFLRAGVDIRITDKSTLGFSGFGIVADKSQSESNSTYLLKDYRSDDTLRYYSRFEEGTGGHPGGNAQINYTLNFNKRHNLLVTASYNHFGFNQRNRYTQEENSDTLVQEQTNDNTDQMVQLKADYEWHPTAQSRLEAGWQTDLGWRKTNANANNIIEKQPQPINTYYNDFHNNEQIHALYLTYGNRFWDRLSVQVGLRGEYMQRHISTTYYNQTNEKKTVEQDTSYFQLFPSAYISYSFPHGHELQLNYTRRVDRPRGHQINPRQDFSDSTNIQYGNPNLLPAYSSALELNYLKTWEKHMISIGLFYRYADGVIQNVKYMEGNVMKNTFINIAKRQAMGVEVIGKNRLFGNLLQLTTSVNAYYNTLSAENYHSTLNGTPVDINLQAQNIFAWSARLNAAFLFTKTFSGQVTARYRSPRVVAQGNSSHSYSIDLGLRKSFLEKKLALSLSVRDLLNSRSRSTTTWGDGFWQYQQRKWNSRTIAMTITYSFGNMKSKDKKPQTDNTPASSYDMEGGDE